MNTTVVATDHQLHPIAGDHDPGANLRRVAAIVAERLAKSSCLDGDGSTTFWPGHCGGTAGLANHQADLDTLLGALLHRYLLLDSGVALRGNRCVGLATLEFVLCGGRDEFDRYLHDGAVAKALDRATTAGPLWIDHLRVLGASYEPMLVATWVGMVFWLVCFWMMRQKIFIRV